MSLKDTCKQMKTILDSVNADLEKAEKGNKAASQRVRTGTIKLEKVAKLYRKESVKAERSGSFKKPKGKGKSSKASMKGKKAEGSKATTKASSSKGKGKQSSAKKPTAKIIKKKK